MNLRVPLDGLFPWDRELKGHQGSMTTSTNQTAIHGCPEDDFPAR